MSTKLFEQAAAAIELATKDKAATGTVAMNVGDLCVILGLLRSLSSQSLSLSEAREENERLKIRECPQEAPGVDFVRLAVAKAICLAMGDDWEREGPGDVLMEAYGPLADAALSATPQGSLPEHADATNDPADLSSLRKGAEVAVKPLEWETTRSGFVWLASSAVGRYFVEERHSDFSWTLESQPGRGYQDTLEGAKSAAQADFETRIRSALVSGSREDGDG